MHSVLTRTSTRPYTRERFDVEEAIAAEKTKSIVIAPTKTADGTILVDVSKISVLYFPFHFLLRKLLPSVTGKRCHSISILSYNSWNSSPLCSSSLIIHMLTLRLCSGTLLMTRQILKIGPRPERLSFFYSYARTL
jgi:hypothetical protein